MKSNDQFSVSLSVQLDTWVWVSWFDPELGVQSVWDNDKWDKVSSEFSGFLSQSKQHDYIKLPICVNM